MVKKSKKTSRLIDTDKHFLQYLIFQSVLFFVFYLLIFFMYNVSQSIVEQAANQKHTEKTSNKIGTNPKQCSNYKSAFKNEINQVIYYIKPVFFRNTFKGTHFC